MNFRRVAFVAKMWAKAIIKKSGRTLRKGMGGSWLTVVMYQYGLKENSCRMVWFQRMMKIWKMAQTLMKPWNLHLQMRKVEQALMKANEIDGEIMGKTVCSLQYYLVNPNL